MAFTNFDTKEIHCKVLYCGPSGAGKTSNFRAVYGKTSQEIKSGLFEMAEKEGIEFFEFLPLSLGYVKDFHIKVHLYALPAQPYYESMQTTILKGVDGLVFVADSRIEALADNIRTWQNVKKLLTNEGINFAELPFVIQYNKRDIDGALPIDLLKQEINTLNFPDLEAVAVEGIGTMETLHMVTKAVLGQIGYASDMPQKG